MKRSWVYNPFNHLVRRLKAMGNGAIVGLIMFVLGVICLLIWGINMDANSGWLVPGVILGAGGFVLLTIFKNDK